MSDFEYVGPDHPDYELLKQCKRNMDALRAKDPSTLTEGEELAIILDDEITNEINHMILRNIAINTYPEDLT